MGKVGFKKIFLMTSVYEFGPLTWDVWDDLLHHRPWLTLGDCFFRNWVKTTCFNEDSPLSTNQHKG